MHDFGSPGLDLAAVAEPLDGPFVSLLGDRGASGCDATIVAGMFERTDGLPYNTLVVVGPDGTLRSTYRKIHLYDSFGYRESERLLAGRHRTGRRRHRGTPGGAHDVLRPAVPRARPRAGRRRAPRLLVVPAAWVAGDHKLDHWRTLLAARAIENMVHVVASAQGGERYTGHSLVIDPWGSIVVEAESAPALLQATVEAEAVVRAREENPSLANRRIRHPSMKSTVQGGRRRLDASVPPEYDVPTREPRIGSAKTATDAHGRRSSPRGSSVSPARPRPSSPSARRRGCSDRPRRC